MPAIFRHFAINADNVPRAKSFYEDVFGWTFDPWGPPGFYQVKNAGSGLLGALQERRELVSGRHMAGYEASFGVEDIRATIAAVEAAGGKIVMPPYRLEGVGELIYFEDSEGNLVGAMQYDPGISRLNASGDGLEVRTLAAGYPTGTVLQTHHHGWGQLVFAASGVMRVTTDDAAWLIPPTRAIWLPAGVGHAIAMLGEVAMRTLYIDMPRAGSLPSLPYVLEVAPLLRELIFHILRIGILTKGRAEHDRLAGLLVDLLIAAEHENLMLPLPRDARALRLAEHWQQHPDDCRDLPILTKNSGASLRTLQRLFVRETGLTLEAWRQQARMIYAVARLAAGASVTNTALDCGYKSMSAFGNAFSRQFGLPPARYITRRPGGGPLRTP